MLKIGGYSSNNGIVLYTDNFQVKATKIKDGSIDIQTKSLEKSRISNNIKKIPFLRGVFFTLPKRWYIFAPILIFLFVELVNITNKNSFGIVQAEEKLIPILLIACLTVCLIIAYTHVSKQKWLQFHSAEHKVIHAYNNKKSIDIMSVSRESNLYTSCGTVYATIMLPLIILSYTITKHFLLSYVLASAVTKEIHNLEKPLEIPIVKYIFKLCLFIQLLTTKEPTVEQLEVGIVCINKLTIEEEMMEQESLLQKR